MKKLLTFFTLCLCILTLTAGVSAEENLFVLDWSDLLTDAEEADLNNHLAAISTENHANIVVATVDSLEGETAQNYADLLYETGLTYFGLMDGTEDGALLLVAMNERQWAISTSGYGITAIHEPALDHMEGEIVSCLSDGDYYEAFLTFGELCGLYWQADPLENDGYYDNVYGEDIYYGSAGETIRYGSAFGPEWIFISLIAGFLIALIPMGILKSQLNTIHMQTGAAAYQKENSVQITRTQDLFLYRNVTKKPIPRDNPSGGSRSGGGMVHTSSSGRSHGGRSGGF